MTTISPILSCLIWDSMNGGPTHRGQWYRMAMKLEAEIAGLRLDLKEATQLIEKLVISDAPLSNRERDYGVELAKRIT